MILGRAPHAVILVGPGSVGKTTLALDLAARPLVHRSGSGSRPCRVCRGCRQVASGTTPICTDSPRRSRRAGSDRQGHDPEPGTVRHLIGELALLAMEGGARVAIVEQAHRLNEDAQNALLKMLEEPPPGVTIVLCADDEESCCRRFDRAAFESGWERSAAARSSAGWASSASPTRRAPPDWHDWPMDGRDWPWPTRDRSTRSGSAVRSREGFWISLARAGRLDWPLSANS